MYGKNASGGEEQGDVDKPWRMCISGYRVGSVRELIVPESKKMESLRGYF